MSGFKKRKLYIIDPDGPGRGVAPIDVQCDLEGQTAVTFIGHDSETRTHVNGFEDSGSYSKDVIYWNSVEQVRALVNQSSHCKQYIKYQCSHSLIWAGSGIQQAWWVTWDGRQADYWGGASPGSGKCACGQTGSCSGRCNCDANDYTWREDSGFLSHKNDLPVTQLRFGDTGSWNEEGYHTLGKLICYP
ncbi:contactin-associated protein-like 5 [Branchiostoma floridae x Branchiostoma belcheri]